jgi:ferredoxin
MQVHIDKERCTGHGRCYAVASDVFDSDDEGYGVVIVYGDLPEDQKDAAQRAVLNCPEHAISLSGF